MTEEKKLRKRSSAGQDPTRDRQELLLALGGQINQPTSEALVMLGGENMPQSFAPGGYGMNNAPGGGLLATQPAGSPAMRMMVATSLINPLIADAEAAIQALGFRVSESVLLDADDASDWAQYLRFGKTGGVWQLTVDTGHVNDDGSWKSVPLHTASRETRLKALSLLPELVEALSGRAEEEADAAMKIVTEATAFVASLTRRHA